MTNYSNLIASLFGIILTCVGIVILWDAQLHLRNAWTLLSNDQSLIISGPYTKIRHPMYLAMSLILFGWSIHLVSWVLVITSVFLSMLFIGKAYTEERMLEKMYGKKYREYKKKTYF